MNGAAKIWELMDEVDAYIPTHERDKIRLSNADEDGIQHNRQGHRGNRQGGAAY